MDAKKKESLDRLENKLSQFKINLKLATEDNDTCDIKFWTKQIRLTEVMIKRIKDLLGKKL